VASCKNPETRLDLSIHILSECAPSLDAAESRVFTAKSYRQEKDPQDHLIREIGTQLKTAVGNYARAGCKTSQTSSQRYHDTGQPGHMSLRMSASYHSLMRRQQVEGFGYRSGRSLNLAPVFRTQRMPSNTKRSSARGRPLLGPTGLSGTRCSIFLHCSSVRNTTRLLTGLTSDESRIHIIPEKRVVRLCAISRA